MTVNTGSGNGTLRLDVAADPTIVDAAGNTLDGGYSSGEVYTIDKVSPLVSSVAVADANPSNASSVNYLVTFSKPVTGVDFE